MATFLPKIMKIGWCRSKSSQSSVVI